jgi:hypothetical protein
MPCRFRLEPTAGVVNQQKFFVSEDMVLLDQLVLDCCCEFDGVVRFEAAALTNLGLSRDLTQRPSRASRRCTQCASQLTLGLQPVIEVVAMFASPREKQVVGAACDFAMRYLRGCRCPLLR